MVKKSYYLEIFSASHCHLFTHRRRRLKGERWAEEDAKKMNTLFSNPAWMFPLMDDTPERLRGGGAGSQYWARRPGDAHQSCPV